MNHYLTRVSFLCMFFLSTIAQGSLEKVTDAALLFNTSDLQILDEVIEDLTSKTHINIYVASYKTAAQKDDLLKLWQEEKQLLSEISYFFIIKSATEFNTYATSAQEDVNNPILFSMLEEEANRIRYSAQEDSLASTLELIKITPNITNFARAKSSKDSNAPKVSISDKYQSKIIYKLRGLKRSILIASFCILCLLIGGGIYFFRRKSKPRHFTKHRWEERLGGKKCGGSNISWP